ncbi:MAG: electron transport complex subunit RsxD [Methylococcales bacterium]|nr:electron transport complex subunit RsxD [Methylococcales bacterium]
MKFETAIAPHLLPVNRVDWVMAKVLLALLPGIIALTVYFGVGVWVNIVIAVITALVLEAVLLKWRGLPVVPALKDLSAMVTAVLLAISLPVIAPWWLVLLGTAFAIVIAKHLYGGLGYNPFNPAMMGYVFLLVSFPVPMTAWIAPTPVAGFDWTVLEQVAFNLGLGLPEQVQFDAITLATPLDRLKTEIALGHPISAIQNAPVFGYISGKGWEWVALGYLLGGCWLLWQKVIGWQIPLGLMLGLALPAGLGYLLDSEQFANPGFHLAAGATMLGAFFIATDPVTAATSSKGRLFYGALIGLLTYLIRTFGGYPDAIAFSVILANLCVPTIDYLTRPRVFGQRS